MNQFFQVTLRTTDVAAAHVFYTRVLGREPDDVVQLHEQALARGARPHWLGFIAVADVDAAASAFIARGATALGPKWVNPEGLEAAVLRDPGGAIVALGKPARTPVEGSRPASPEVVWYALNSADAERARANYGALFGWQFEPPVALGELGEFYPFAWDDSGVTRGSVSEIAGRSGVHPHWLLQFRVASLASAVEAVRAGGGVVIGPLTLPDGEQLAICDDAQGAAFALRESAAR